MRKKGENKAQQGHAYGIASVSNALGGVDFPMTKQDLIERYGEKQIEWKKGNPAPLKDVLREIEEESQFESMADVVSAVSRGHRRLSETE